MKRLLALLLGGVLLLGGCASKALSPEAAEKPLKICATLFPQYDFAREIAGDRASVTLLLLPGVESHSFAPTPADVAGIGRSDLLLYTGDEMEPWVKTLLADHLPDTLRVVDLSQGISLAPVEEHGEAHADEAHAKRGHDVDPHIWTSPVNAVQMVKNLVEALCQADPAGESLYRANGEAYCKKLAALDADFRAIVEGAARREIVFGGRFAFGYFAREYGLVPYAAFDSCSEETEPSARALAEIVALIREKQIPVVYYEELVDPKVARSIAAETGARLLLLHSCHNLSKEELAAGENYLSLMGQNAENLREGLWG